MLTLILPVLLATGSAGLAYAAPEAFVAGETLTAAKLNANFDDLNARIEALDLTAADNDARLSALEGSAIVENVTITAQASLAIKNNPVAVGSIVVSTPGPGKMAVSAVGGSVGFLDHVAGTSDQMACCISESQGSCPTAVSRYDIHRSVPSLPGGAEGIHWPVSAAAVYDVNAAGSHEYFLVCSWQAGAGAGAFAGNGVSLTATFSPTTSN
jgi:hypothetical protein